MRNTTFIHAADAALMGLPAGVRGDQALTHCSRPLLLCGLSGGVVYQWAPTAMRPALVLYAMPKSLFGEQHLARQLGIAFALKGNGKFFRTRAGAVGYVLQVTTGRINSQGESLTLFNAQTLPIGFKVHD